MTARIPPGLRLIGRGLLALATSAFAIISVQNISSHFGTTIPTWLVVLGGTLALPTYASGTILFRSISHRRQAAALGARLAPQIRGKWFGNIDMLLKLVHNLNHGYIGDGFPELVEEHGSTFNMYMMWDDLIVTIDPNHIKLILATNFNNYVKGESFRQAVHSFLGTGVFNSDGDMWKFHRSMTRPFFNRDRISHFDIFDRHAEDVIQSMKLRFRAGYAVDFQDIMGRFTLDSATEFLLGNCVHSLSAGLPYPHNVVIRGESKNPPSGDFSFAFLTALLRVAKRERIGWLWPLFEIFKDKTEDPMKVVDAFLYPIIKDAIEKKQETSPLSDVKADTIGDDETVLGHLVNFTSDPVVIKDEVLNILLAGRDTTAATLTFVTYCLAMYPAVFTRLREEILSRVGPARKPTLEDVREMKYLRAVINETLRLYPVVPFNVRESISATTWPSPDPTGKPIYIPAGTRVSYSVFMMHRRTDLWGPDAEEFDPDRFLDERVKKYLVNNSFIFLPFNAGPRICLGQQFAYNEMSFMLVRLLQNFSSISLDPDSQPPASRPPAEWASEKGRKSIERFWPKSHLTMYSEGGLWVKMSEADSEVAQ